MYAFSFFLSFFQDPFLQVSHRTIALEANRTFFVMPESNGHVCYEYCSKQEL